MAKVLDVTCGQASHIHTHHQPLQGARGSRGSSQARSQLGAEGLLSPAQLAGASGSRGALRRWGASFSRSRFRPSLEQLVDFLLHRHARWYSLVRHGVGSPPWGLRPRFSILEVSYAISASTGNLGRSRQERKYRQQRRHWDDRSASKIARGRGPHCHRPQGLRAGCPHRSHPTDRLRLS